jgi:hypothetical protein
MGKILLLVASLVICMEGATRVILSIDPPPRWITGVDDSSCRLKWIRLHQSYHGVTGVYSVYHSIRGWALKSNIKDQGVFDGKILNTNSKGFRGKTEYDYQRNPSKNRILVLGDSFTFGLEVSDDETYPHYLEAALPNTEVLNLGVAGYGQDQMLLYLKEEGAKYHPDVVILGFVYVDMYRNLRTFFSYAKPKFKLTSGALELTNVPVPAPDRVLAEEPYHSKALDLGVILRERVLWRLGVNERKSKELTRSLFDEILATTRTIGAVPVFVYLPVYQELLDSSDDMSGGERYFYEYCQARSVSCLLLRPGFREDIKRGVKFNSQSHWNPATHKAAAQGIRDFLLNNNLIVNSSHAYPSLVSAAGQQVQSVRQHD